MGIAHAVGLYENFVEGDRFVVYLGDNLLQNSIKRYLKDFEGGDYDAYVAFERS